MEIVTTIAKADIIGAGPQLQDALNCAEKPPKGSLLAAFSKSHWGKQRRLAAANGLKESQQRESVLGKLKALNGEIQVLPDATSGDEAELLAWVHSFKTTGVKKIAALLATKWDLKADNDYSTLVRSSIIFLVSKLQSGEEHVYKCLFRKVAGAKASDFEDELELLRWLAQNRRIREGSCTTHVFSLRGASRRYWIKSPGCGRFDLLGL